MHTFAEAAADAADEPVYSLLLTTGQAHATLRALNQMAEADADAAAARARLATLLDE